MRVPKDGYRILANLALQAARLCDDVLSNARTISDSANRVTFVISGAHPAHRAADEPETVEL
jgi:hypothetical protein